MFQTYVVNDASAQKSIQDRKDANQKAFFKSSAHKSKSENSIHFFPLIPKARMQDAGGKVKYGTTFNFESPSSLSTALLQLSLVEIKSTANS